MPVAFEEACCPPLDCLTVAAPGFVVIGLLGDETVRTLLRLAAGLEQPISGIVTVDGRARLVGPADPLDLTPIDVLLLDQALALRDGIARAHAATAIEQLRRSGSTILIYSHELDLLRRSCDEIWWLEGGRLAAKGDPGEVIDRYLRHLAQCAAPSPLSPSQRSGDGAARVLAVETPAVWQSGEPAAIRVTVRFERPSEDPILGILIRNRIGLEIYGTNTRLENVTLGRRAAGDSISVTFAFDCLLAAGAYTVTVAAQDAGGLPHDWLEDAVAVTVVSSRPFAGLVNLRARVAVG